MVQKNLNKGEIIIYKTSRGPKLDVKLDKQTIWITQKQMAELFEKDVRTVNEHIKNIVNDGELQEKAVIRKFRITAKDGKMYNTSFYNLDMIISSYARGSPLMPSKERPVSHETNIIRTSLYVYTRLGCKYTKEVLRVMFCFTSKNTAISSENR